MKDFRKNFFRLSILFLKPLWFFFSGAFFVALVCSLFQSFHWNQLFVSSVATRRFACPLGAIVDQEVVFIAVSSFQGTPGAPVNNSLCLVDWVESSFKSPFIRCLQIRQSSTVNIFVLRLHRYIYSVATQYIIRVLFHGLLCSRSPFIQLFPHPGVKY